MAYEYQGSTVRLLGRIDAELCEELQNWLRSQEAPEVDLSGCEQLHAAGLQCLLALRPRITAPSPDPWLNAALSALIQVDSPQEAQA